MPLNKIEFGRKELPKSATWTGFRLVHFCPKMDRGKFELIWGRSVMWKRYTIVQFWARHVRKFFWTRQNMSAMLAGREHYWIRNSFPNFFPSKILPQKFHLGHCKVFLFSCLFQLSNLRDFTYPKHHNLFN